MYGEKKASQCVNGVSPLGTLVFFVHQILSFFIHARVYVLFMRYTGGEFFFIENGEKNVRDKPHNTIMFG